MSYLNRASARNYGLRLGSFVGLKKRSEGETWYLYSAIHRRFGASRLSVAPRSLYVHSRSHRGSYICVFCVFCTFRVFRPTYLPVLQKYFTFRASPHKRHRRTAHDSEPIGANLRLEGFVPIGSESFAARLCLLCRHALTIYSDNRQDG